MALFKKRTQLSGSTNSHSSGEPPRGESWEVWYARFKAVATSGNSRLQLQNSNQNILDLMDHQPLKDAFHRGIDATELGVQFAADFDVGAFLRDNGIFR
jgi:hypothetical protein